MPDNYPSPTTPGLQIDFKNLVVELVCLNMQPKLGARFWVDRAYWRPKYGREIRGFQKCAKLRENLDDPVMQRAVIEAIKETRCMTLLNERNLSRLDRCVDRKHAEMVEQRRRLAESAPVNIPAEEYMRRNTRLADVGGASRLKRILEIESGQEENADKQ